VGAAVVVTREPEAARRPQDEQRRRVEQPGRPSRRYLAEPGVRGTAKQLRRVERRQIVRARKVVVLVLESRPGGVDHERRQPGEPQQRLNPPPVATRGFAERSLAER